MFWLVYAALTLVAGSYVLAPLFRDSEGNPDADLMAETEVDRLLSRKTGIYRNIRDLEFEYAMGRLSETDFRRLEADYKNDAALILQKIDQLGISESLDEEIEKEISARKAKLDSPGASRDQKSNRCPSCGADVVPGKKFCADCGKRL
jgi:hypothetical protein